ncbi:MAG: RNA polymerase sigma factor [Anaerobacillus sp.]|uniref:RNA polymerase sigma factor n=1 Tax=Anaerobacillus sp. TaxID=1872506 RepID=UPI003919A519
MKNDVNTLLTEIKGANESSFEKLYIKMHKAVFALALSIIRDKSLAEDVVQETFIRIKTKSNSYQEGTNGPAWIFQITRNLSLNLLKKRKCEINIFNNNNSIDELILKQNSSKDRPQEVEMFIERYLLQEAFTKLNENERQIVILHAVSGLKHREIAALLNISQVTERWYYIRALEKLRKILSNQIKL